MREDNILEIINDWNLWRKDIESGIKREAYLKKSIRVSSLQYGRDNNWDKKSRQILPDQANGKRIGYPLQKYPDGQFRRREIWQSG